MGSVSWVTLMWLSELIRLFIVGFACSLTLWDVLISLSVSVCFSVCLSGACEGTLACSTCHLIFEEDVYNKLGPITDEEMDMLDLAYGLTDT